MKRYSHRHVVLHEVRHVALPESDDDDADAAAAARAPPPAPAPLPPPPPVPPPRKNKRLLEQGTPSLRAKRARAADLDVPQRAPHGLRAPPHDPDDAASAGSTDCSPASSVIVTPIVQPPLQLAPRAHPVHHVPAQEVPAPVRPARGVAVGVRDHVAPAAGVEPRRAFRSSARSVAAGAALAPLGRPPPPPAPPLDRSLLPAVGPMPVLPPIVRASLKGRAPRGGLSALAVAAAVAEVQSGRVKRQNARGRSGSARSTRSDRSNDSGSQSGKAEALRKGVLDLEMAMGGEACGKADKPVQGGSSEKSESSRVKAGGPRLRGAEASSRPGQPSSERPAIGRRSPPVAPVIRKERGPKVSSRRTPDRRVSAPAAPLRSKPRTTERRNSGSGVNEEYPTFTEWLEAFRKDHPQKEKAAPSSKSASSLGKPASSNAKACASQSKAGASQSKAGPSQAKAGASHAKAVSAEVGEAEAAAEAKRIEEEQNDLLKLTPHADAEGIVWTKIYGHPFWPSQVVDVSPALAAQPTFKAAAEYKKRGNESCVQYFGTLEIAWVSLTRNCIPWDAGVHKRLHLAMAARAVYHDAINEVKQLCGRTTRYPRGWWCEPRSLVLATEFLKKCSGEPSSSDKEVAQKDAEADAQRLKRMYAVAKKDRVVWAKVRGFPDWPVQIVPYNTACKEFPELKLPSSPTRPTSGPLAATVPCMFFGTREVANLPEKGLHEFERGVAAGYVTGSNRHDFRNAIGEVYGFLQTPRVWPLNQASGRNWWNTPDIDTEAKVKKTPAIPKFEFLRKSVWPEGESPPPRSRRCEIPVCACDRKEGACLESSCLNYVSRILCDPSTCPAGDSCQNVVFNKRPKRPLEVFYTPDGRGFGLRATKLIRKGDFVVEYVGEIVDQAECESRLKKKGDNSDYYMMEISSDHVLDASKKGNYSRFINSSCAPNCATQKWTCARTGQTHVGIFALENIPAEREILYNYCFEDFGLASKKGKRSFVCRCGANNCRMYDCGEFERTLKVIGRRIKVRWDDGWYFGFVERYDPADKAFIVQYDDGDTERLGLGEPSSWGKDVLFKLDP